MSRIVRCSKNLQAVLDMRDLVLDTFSSMLVNFNAYDWRSKVGKASDTLHIIMLLVGGANTTFTIILWFLY